jgi:hypothetical protein
MGRVPHYLHRRILDEVAPVALDKDSSLICHLTRTSVLDNRLKKMNF